MEHLLYPAHELLGLYGPLLGSEDEGKLSSYLVFIAPLLILLDTVITEKWGPMMLRPCFHHESIGHIEHTFL